MSTGTSAPTPETQRALGYCPVISLFITVFVSSALRCTCGHMFQEALLVTSFAAVLSWLPFVCKHNRGWRWRIFVLAVIVLSTYTLLRNIVDVLWLGHYPLLLPR